MEWEKIEQYCHTLNNNNRDLDYYNEIIRFQNDHYIPAVRFETALFLKMMTASEKPVSILEIGFGSGVSSIFMLNGHSSAEQFISLERDNNRYIRGIALLDSFQIDGINLNKTDALQFIKLTDKTFDFIFLDAVKREYINYLTPLKRVLKPGGMFICDNILFNGKVVEDPLPEKYRNGVALLKEFNKTLSLDNDFTVMYLTIGDGLSVARKK